MGWFARLLGKTPEKPTVRSVLEGVAQHAGILDATIEPIADDVLELRGTLRSFAVRLAVDVDSGEVECARLRCNSKLTFLELEYAEHGADPDEEPTPRIAVATGITVEGVHAERQAKTFSALPADLGDRLAAEMRRLGITTFTSHRAEISLQLDQDAFDVAEPARWLADALVLGADVALARGAGPPRVRSLDADRARAMRFAAALEARTGGKRTVHSADPERIEVCWISGAAGVRVVTSLPDLDVAIEAIPGTDWTDAEQFTMEPRVPEQEEAVFALMEERELASATVDGRLLAVTLYDLDDAGDDGAVAQEVAIELGRICSPAT